MKNFKYSQGIRTKHKPFAHTQNATTGITLIALVITIIVLLILAGITISLTIGQHGILNMAKYAGVKTEEEMAREKLELVLVDLQAKKYTDETYNETTYINAEINKNKMTISGDTVLVDGWKFGIDRSVPKITRSFGKGEVATINITTSYIGTSSFTVNVTSAYNEEEIEEYKYKIDEDEITTIKKEYIVEKELAAESTHTVQVIAKYKDGTTLESNILTVKTEPRTYIMKDGKFEVEVEGAIIKNATLTPNLENGYIKLKIGPVVKRGGYIFPYDVTSYKKVKIDAEVTVDTTGYNLSFGIMDKNEDCFTTKKDDFTITGILKRDIYELNVGTIEEIWQIQLIKGATSSESTIEANIYSLWLEK